MLKKSALALVLSAVVSCLIISSSFAAGTGQNGNGGIIAPRGETGIGGR